MISFILRVISIIMTILIIVPSFLMVCITRCVFTILNNFTYHNFINYDLSEFNNSGIDIRYYGISKIFTMIVAPIIQFFIDFSNGVKSIKF